MTVSLEEFGAEVSVVEMMPRLLPPFDADLARHLAADFKKKGISVVTKAAVKEISQGEDGLIVTYELAGEKKEIAADGVFIATGRRIAWRDILPFDLDEEQHVIRVDENGLTSRPHLYAIGDITSGMPPLAHAAEARAKRAAAAIAGKSSDIFWRLSRSACIPSRKLLRSVSAKTKRKHRSSR